MIFFLYKTKNYFFYIFDKAWIRYPDPGSGSGIRNPDRMEILGWIRIRIKRMRMCMYANVMFEQKKLNAFFNLVNYLFGIMAMRCLFTKEGN